MTRGLQHEIASRLVHPVKQDQMRAGLDLVETAGIALVDELPFDPVRKRIMTERVAILAPELLTEPSCYFLALDKEVR